ncbi:MULTISPECIES: M3 family oligoendopeptidase [unclassified Granulicatella]|uniref:M3 family oligoendopeptidase n=1 Tax=unclassified Granulicatella TaxID=2630493 RepID=UPI001073B8FD|nr:MULTISPECIES: M3 family oligoendopeptidase [unclassified Granulicatella]MBF0779702.1 M3 family oligoendopeptidase [Granulicatella sp. 19428wC4_WM01]TFU96224.1 M3 family oligoendopeptidase [Granulicatella sp. WM01]
MSGEWSLKELYPSYESQEYQQDITELIQVYKHLETLELEDNITTIRQVITLLERQSVLVSRLFSFSQLQLAVNTTDEKSLQANTKIQKIYSEYAKVIAKVSKFIGSIQTDIMQDEHLAQYAFFFKQAKEEYSHILSDDVEEVIAIMNMSAGSAWGQMQEYLTSTVETLFNGESVTLSEIRNLAYDPDAKVRKAAYETELNMYRTIKEPVAFSLNNIKSQVNDVTRLKGYESALEHALSISRMSRGTLNALLDAIKDFLPSFRRYLKHKARLLGHENGLPFYDLFAPIGQGNDKKLTIEETRAYLVKHFAKFSDDLAKMTDEFFENHYIDVYPRKGKVGGAFCHNLPYINQSRIMLNFDGSLSNIVTTAHELGHAYHGLHIESHLPLNWEYSMPVAETASTFNEALIMNSIMSEASDEEKVSLIESELQDTTQIIVDIYSRFLFESAVFEQRKDKFLFSKDLEALMLHAQKEAYGDGLDENALHPFMWACKPHYYDTHFSFYNFPYAFGGLFSKGLYAMYKQKTEGFVEKYQAMLRETTVTSVEDTAKTMGVDVTTKAFWSTGLKQIEQQIDEFIRLTSK